jgi:high-affinity nickel permease
MISLFAIVAVGLLLGMRHATDPDHVIAVCTIVSREGNLKRAALIGSAWGVGHTLTILLVGSAMVIFRILLPARLGLAMELAVGLMLVYLGLKNLRSVFACSVGRVATDADCNLQERIAYHSHGDYVHTHHHPDANADAHDPQRNPVAAMDRRFSGWMVYTWTRPLIVGVVHGLAGSAAIALLVLSTIPTIPWAMAYLAVFGIGTTVGMMLITLTIGSTFSCALKRFARVGPYLGWVAGMVSLAFGVFIAYHISFVDGLFNTQANCVPR